MNAKASLWAGAQAAVCSEEPQISNEANQTVTEAARLMAEHNIGRGRRAAGDKKNSLTAQV